MGLSKLSAKCRACPYADKCDHKRQETLGLLPDPPLLAPTSNPAAASAAQPILRETMEIRVEDKPVIVYKDEIEKQLYGHLYKGLGLLMSAT